MGKLGSVIAIVALVGCGGGEFVGSRGPDPSTTSTSGSGSGGQGSGDAGSDAHQAPPNCVLATPQQAAIIRGCAIGLPQLVYDCPNGAPPDSAGCELQDPAHPELWCCP